MAAWSRRPQFTINLTLFQRLPLHAQVNQLVGDFTSTTLLSTDCASAQTFAEHARNLQAQLWRDLDHRYVSGVRVIRDLARSGKAVSSDHACRFTSGLAQGMPELAALERLQGPGLGELIYGLSQTPQVWLDHQVYEQEGALQFNWDAVEELFPSGLLDDMFAAYRSYLRRLAHEEAAWTEANTPRVPSTLFSQYAAVNDASADLLLGGAGEITTTLLGHPLVADAVVIKAQGMGNRLIGYAVPTPVGDDAPQDSGEAPWPTGTLISAPARNVFGQLTPELRAFLRDTELLEHLSSDVIIETLQSLGVFKTADETWSAEQIVEHCRVQPRYGGLVARWLRFLAADGLLIRDSSQRYSCARPLVPRANVGEALERGTSDDPLIGYLHACRRNLVAILRGEVSPLEILFPGGDWRIAESLYEHNPVARHLNGQAARIVQELVAGTTGEIRVLD